MSDSDLSVTTRIKEEWTTFTADKTAFSVGTTYRGNDKGQLTWHCSIGGECYFLILYKPKSIMTPKTKPNGYLLLDDKYNVVRKRSLCTDAIRAYRVWAYTYYSVPIKQIIFQQRVAMQKLDFYAKFYGQCEARLSEDRYEANPDPLERRLGIATRKLDRSFVSAYNILTERVRIDNLIRDAQLKIWTSKSFESVKTYVEQSLVQLEESNIVMSKYLTERAEIMVESKRALDEYIANLRGVRLANSAYAVLALLASINKWFYGFIVVAAGETAKNFYNEFTSYKKLIRSVAKLEKMAVKIEQIKDKFYGPVSEELIRGLRH